MEKKNDDEQEYDETKECFGFLIMSSFVLGIVGLTRIIYLICEVL